MVVGSKVMLKSRLSPGGRERTLSMMSIANPDPSSAKCGMRKEIGVQPLLERWSDWMGIAAPYTTYPKST